MLLYIHVPFCVRKCRYCAFHSGRFRGEDVRRYMDLLLQEMTLRAAWTAGRTVDSIYVGGGTPSLLEPEQLAAILDRAAVLWNVCTDAEVTVEANPESAIRPGFLEALRRMGVNRLSLGVQSLQDDLLRRLGRPHDRVLAIRAAEAAGRAGFGNLSLDLIWGLPGQTRDMWLADLADCIALQPGHLSCYGLTVEDGTELARQVEAGLELPTDDECARMYADGVSLLECHGYAQYEVSNFAQPDRHSRHNRGYWTGRDYLGCGPSAVSTLGNRRLTNPYDLSAYGALVCGGGEADTEILTGEDLLHEWIMLSLRMREGLDLDKFKAMTGEHAAVELRKAVEPLCSSGLVRLEAGHLLLTSSGMLVSNSIIALVLDLADPERNATGNL